MTLSQDTFRAISDPTRRSILDALLLGERSVSELCAFFDMTQPAVSQHLKVLRDAGLVKPRQEGRQRFYQIEAKPLREVRDWVSHYERVWTEKLDKVGESLDREAKKSKK